MKLNELIEESEMVTCDECHGRGMVKYPHQGEMEWDVCRTCDGKKKIPANQARRKGDDPLDKYDVEDY